MDIRRVRRTLWVGLLALGSSIAGPAAAVDVTINTTISSMTVTGTGLMPFGTGPAGVNDGYLFVDSQVTATTSSTTASTGSTVLSVDLTLDPNDPLNIFAATVTVGTQSTFNFFLDLTFEDVDPANDYATGLGTSFTLLADPLKPLTIQLTDSITFVLADVLANPDVFPDNPGIAANSNTVVRPLGVDVNSSGLLDFIAYSAQSFEFGDDLTFSDDVFTNVTVDDLVFDILAGNPLPDFNASVSILSGSFIFTGQVADALTDPPFSIQLVGPGSLVAVPEPGTLALLGLALAALGFSARGRARAPGRLARGTAA